MNDAFEFLAEKEAMWAEMLMEVLRDNDIPCASMPVLGAGFAMKTGIPERLRVFVPADMLPQAQGLLEELFSGAEVAE